jgi:methylated-DNA-[protein]-cysteine S-methyltransferase
LRLLAGEDGSLVAVHFVGASEAAASDRGWVRDEARLAPAARQLAEYFAGTRRAFDLPLRPRGTAFQRRVWAALCDIPYGQTISYAELAARIRNPRAVRAVGLANGANPLAIVVPCHRVIGSTGRLVGYGGGLPIKQRLLELEGALPAPSGAVGRLEFV